MSLQYLNFFGIEGGMGRIVVVMYWDIKGLTKISAAVKFDDEKR